MQFRDDERPYRPQKRGRRLPLEEPTFRRLLAAARRAARGGARQGTAARVLVPPTAGGLRGARDRRVVIKARYVQWSSEAEKGARKHLQYIEREGVERDGSPGVLYNATQMGRAVGEQQDTAIDSVALEGGAALEGPDSAASAPAAGESPREVETIRQAMLTPLPGEKHQFRIIVSPEDAGRLDLTEFVRRLMLRVEKDLGQPLIWAAVNHYNTDDPHTHIVIRGVDRNGAEVRFDRRYISRIWRERAQEIVTQELGPRTEFEYQRQRTREVGKLRLTSLDRELGRRAVRGVVQSEGLDGPLRARLKVLERLQFARRLSARTWALEDGWQQRLRAEGERGDIIKQMHYALRERVAASRYHVVHRFEPLPGIEAGAQGGREVVGRVAAMGLDDKSPGAMYAIVESLAGGGYYVPLWQSETSGLRVGSIVTLRQVQDGETPRARVVLRAHKLSLSAQVRYEGPTWLDEVELSGVGRGDGELQQLRAQRARYLAERGIEPRQLDQLERRRLAERFARSARKTVAVRAAGFRGRLTQLYEAPSGRQYAVIANELELIVVRAGRKVQRLVGRDVALDYAARSQPGQFKLEIRSAESEPERGHKRG